MTSGEGVTPEVTPVQATPSPMCAAILLRRQFAMEQEAATIAEANTGERVRTPRLGDMPALACKACKDSVSFTYDEQLDAPSCINVNSGSCEEIWIGFHPDEYKANDGTLAVKSLFCGRCPANLELTQQPDGQIDAKVSDSACGVDKAGERFRKSGMADLNRALPSLEEMLRQKQETEEREETYQEGRERARIAEYLAWAEANPEEAAQEEATIQSTLPHILPQDAQEEARTEDNSGEGSEDNSEAGEDWEVYDGDPNADLDVPVLQELEANEYSDELPDGSPALQGYIVGHPPLWSRRGRETQYPTYSSAYDWWSDPRWPWLTGQLLDRDSTVITAQPRHDAIRADK